MAAVTHEAVEAGDFGLHLPFSAESARVAREQLVRWLHSVETHDEIRENARLVVSELVGNAVRHARPLADGTMHVTWGREPQGLAIAVSDGGARTEPHLVDAAVSDVSGRGMAIVETLASRWWVETTRARTTVHAVLPVT